MMVLASVADNSFSILLPFSLPHASTHSRQRAWEQASPSRIRPTPSSTPTHAVAIAHPRGCFTLSTHHCFCHTGKKLALSFSELMCKWYVEKILFSLSLDNASANEAALGDIITNLKDVRATLVYVMESFSMSDVLVVMC
jgi:hypothetical protein